MYTSPVSQMNVYLMTGLYKAGIDITLTSHQACVWLPPITALVGFPKTRQRYIDINLVLINTNGDNHHVPSHGVLSQGRTLRGPVAVALRLCPTLGHR